MTAPARLDVDVLAVVCEFLSDVSDVISMTLTCSSIHPIAVGWLLRMRPVYLKSGPSIRRFHSFLFHDTPARAPHVRVVQIDLRSPGMPQDQVDDLSLLLDILNVCKHIEHITVAFEQLSRHMVENPHIVQAITAISSLRSLSVWSASVTTLALLHQISAPLRTVIIYCHNQSLRFWYPAALEPFLPRVTRSLEKFEVGRFGVDPVVIQAESHISSPPTVSLSKYPAVRSLSVQSFRGKPLLEDLQYLFPAIDGTLSLGSLDVQCGEDTYDHIRATNQHAQERDGSGRSPSRAWKRLDRIICDAQMLYVLGLRCPIRLAMIDFGPVYKHGRYVADALRENPVPRLKLTLEHNFDDFGGLCSPELAETLTHLTLCLLYTTDYGITPRDRHAGAAPQLKWDDDTIVSTIQPLHKLTHLRIVIGASVYVSKDASWPFAPWEEYAHSFRESRFDFEGTAAALARSLPSLHNVFLTTGGYFSNWDEPADQENGGRWKLYERWYITRGWRFGMPVTDGIPEGDRRVVELHDEVVDTIIRKEELIISEWDEAALHLNYGWHASPPPLRV